MGSLHSPAELKVTGAGVDWVEREMRGDRIFVQNNFRCSVPYVQSGLPEPLRGLLLRRWSRWLPDL